MAVTAAIDALNRAAAAASRRADELEDPLAEILEKIIVAAGREAANKFTEKASALRAAGEPPGWHKPAPDELIDTKALAKKLRGKTDPVRRKVIEAAAGSAVSGVGLDWDVDNPYARAALENAAEQVTQITETTRENVRGSVQAAYEEGLSIPDTAALIRQGMADAAPARARLIARTELVGAANAGSLAAAQTVGAALDTEIYKRWLTAFGAKHPRHNLYIGLNGQTRKLDGFFEVGGHLLLHPGDPKGPPGEVCNCRCSMSYTEDPNPMPLVHDDPVSMEAQQRISELGLRDWPPRKGVTAQEVLGDAEDTEKLYGDNNWAARRELHEKILDDMFDGKTVRSDEPTAFFTAGGAASGKGSATFRFKGKTFGTDALGERSDTILLDPDEIKKRIPEYQKMLETRDPYAAFGVHEESSYLARLAFTRAEERGLNVVIDGVGGGPEGKFLGKMKAAKQAGYHVQASYVSAPTPRAVERMISRGDRTGRYVAVDAMIDGHITSAARHAEWRLAPDIDSWTVWDNTGRPPKLVAEGGKGRVKVRDPEAYDQILRKADQKPSDIFGHTVRPTPAAPEPPAVPAVAKDGLALPTTAQEGAESFVQGLVRTQKEKNLPPDAATATAARTVWRKALAEDADFDPEVQAKIRAANEHNQQNPTFKRWTDLYGDDVVVVAKREVEPGSLLWSEGAILDAKRIADARVTVLARSAVDAEVSGPIRPRDFSTAKNGGLSALLRHEYGHQIADGMDASLWDKFLRELPDREAVARELTYYASKGIEPGNVGDARNAFVELFAVVTDPAYVPEDWPVWVRRMGHEWFDSPVVSPRPMPKWFVGRDADVQLIREEYTTNSQAAKTVSEASRTIHGDELAKLYDDIYPAKGVAPLQQRQNAALLRIGHEIDREIEKRVPPREPYIDHLAHLDQRIFAAKEAAETGRSRWMAAREQAERKIVVEAEKNHETIPWYEMRGRVDNDPLVAEAAQEKARLDGIAYNLERERATVIRERAQLESGAAFEVLQEFQQFGATKDIKWKFTTNGRGSKGKKAVDEAAAFYPTEWIRRTKEMKIVWSESRGWHTGGVGGAPHEMKLGSVRVAVHELGHAQEAESAELLNAEWAYYQWRTRGRDWNRDAEPLQHMGPGYGRREVTRPDEFFTRYAGKDYGGRAYELFTMGIETLTYNPHALDPEYRAWLLAVLAMF